MQKNQLKRIILLGPQGAGKSTQGALLAKFLDLREVSAGEILRQAMFKRNALSRELKAFVTPGLLVPDRLVISLVIAKLNQSAFRRGFILDGFPRNLHQARALDKNFVIDKVFNLDISNREAIRRLSGRLVCRRGHVWHTSYRPSKKKGICDQCGQPLFVRADDRGPVIARRLAIYRQKTELLLRYYRSSGRLAVFNGEQSIRKISQTILAYARKYAG